MAKWIAAEKGRAELRQAVVCPNVTGRTKERIAQSKRARAGSLAIVDYPPVARTCILRADVMLSFSGVTFALFGFVFVFILSLKPRPFVQSSFVLRYACVPTAIRVSSSFFGGGGDVAFSAYFLYHYRFLFAWRVRRTFSPSGWCLFTL